MRRTPAPTLLVLAGLLLAAAAPARRVVTLDLPPEPEITLPKGQGSELAQGTCSACHSLDYILMQPRGKGAGFWKDEVAKMGKAYGARIDPRDAEAIAAYLARTYG
jgi:mono/diheme cytochrome c family protein